MSSAAQPDLLCPICKSRQFVAFNGRENARCSGCLSVERNRLLWMVLECYGMFRPGLRVFHIAPELALIRRFSDLSGERYHACDIDPSHYKSRYTVVRPMNLCCDLVKLPSRSFDLILHSHVLEHVNCDPEDVLREMERLLAPGGHHFLSVPVIGEYTREDMSDSLTPEDRAKRFGQSDHYRVFGSISFKEVLDRVWGAREKHNVEPLELFAAEELQRAAIPAAAWSGLTSHTVFHHVRDMHRSVRIAEPETEKPQSAVVVPAPSNVPDPSSPVLHRPQLLLHIGAALPQVSTMQQWLTANCYGALRAGLDYWQIAESHSEVMFYAFANSDRHGRAETWFQRDSGRSPIGPEECRARLSDFLSRLDGRTGVISAEVLWSFGRADVAAIASYLRERNVATRILCFVCSPFEQAAALARQRCRTSLALEDFGLPLASSLVIDYRRLERWTGSFGAENVSVVPIEHDMIEPFRTFLPTIGISAPPHTFVEDNSAVMPSMVAAKSLLALNQYLRSDEGGTKKRSRRLRELLTNIKGEAFEFPETAILRIKSTLQQEARYLSEKFALETSWSLRDCPSIDDPRFFEWSQAEIVSLLGALNEIFLKNEEP